MYNPNPNPSEFDAAFETAPEAGVPVEDAFEAAFSAPILRDPIQKTHPHSSEYPASTGWEGGNVQQWINSHGYWIRERHPVGYHAYPQGLWSISRIRKQEGYTIEGDFIRYCDALQLREMEQVLNAGLLEELEGLILAVGVKEGPVRASDKPRIDPRGNPIVEVNNGNHGSLPDECEWIESKDPVYVQYMGTDDNWPRGCWAIESSGEETQYFDDEGIKYIAHTTLGMPLFKSTKSAKPRVSGNSWEQPITLSVDLPDFPDDEDEPTTEEPQYLGPQGYGFPNHVPDFDAAFGKPAQTQTVSFDDAFRDPFIPF